MYSMKRVTKNHILILLTTGLLVCGNSIAVEKKTRDEHSQLVNMKIFSNEENRVSKYSEDKKYKVSLYSNQFPLVTGKIHSWTLQVLSLDGKPIEDVKIYVHGGMPIHQHGFPTNPRITKYLGNGRYLVSGLKFSMSGDWELRFNIKETTKRDRVIFNVKV